MNKDLLTKDAILAVVLFLTPTAVLLLERDNLKGGLGLVALILAALGWRLAIKVRERKIQN